MAITPGRGGRRAACGLAAAVAAVLAVLGGESPARAAPEGHSKPAATMRIIQHYRLIRNTNTERGGGSGQQAAKAVRPWRIDIPSIGVAADLMTLGGTDGAGGLSLPVPPLAKAASYAGWYQFTSIPGATGNAVIVGHVDTYIGPAVFYNLYQLRPGDLVYVDAGGTRQRFDVTFVRELPKPDFPVNQVFGSTESHMLWLITCGGAFDYQTRHYLDNIVVSAFWDPAAGKHPGIRDKSSAKHSENHEETVR
jgi:LPXTG-site transpeptidase (sortase) family protein